jgi:hypothetical protein
MTDVDDILIYSHREVKRLCTGIALVGYAVGVVTGAAIVFLLATAGKLPL